MITTKPKRKVRKKPIKPADLVGLQYLTKIQLASLLQKSVRTIEGWTAAKRIPHIKMGKSVMYDMGEVRASLQRHTIKAVHQR